MKLFSIISFLLLGACAQYPSIPDVEPPKPKPVACDSDSAYEAGVNDGMYRVPMDSGAFTKCDAASQAKLRKSYKDGYHKGLEVKTPEPTHKPSDDTYSGNKGGVSIIVGSNYSKAWMCELSPFVKDYKAFGATEQEASYNVEKLCERDNHSMHCDDPKCVPTR